MTRIGLAPLVALLIVHASLTACAVRQTVHLTPDIDGTVIDARTLEPVSGITVALLEHDVADTSAPDGSFHLPAVSETRYFQPLLPGTSVEFTPIMAVSGADTTAVGWGVQYWDTGQSPPRSEILLFHVPPGPGADDLPEACRTDAKARYFMALMSAIEDHLDTAPYRGFLAEHTQVVVNSLEGLMHHAHVVADRCGLVASERSELTRPLRRTYDLIHGR